MDLVTQLYMNANYMITKFNKLRKLLAILLVLSLMFSTSVFAATTNLTWTANTEADMSYYKVYRSCTQNGTYSVITTVTHPSASFQDNTACTPESWYYITAVDTTEHESSPSLKANKVFVVGAGNAPSGLTVVKVSNGIQINWIDGSGGIAETEIWRGNDNEPMHAIVTVPAGVTSFLDQIAMVNTPNPVTFLCDKIRHKYSNGVSNFFPDESQGAGQCITWSKSDSVKPAAPTGGSLTP